MAEGAVSPAVSDEAAVRRLRKGRENFMGGVRLGQTELRFCRKVTLRSN